MPVYLDLCQNSPSFFTLHSSLFVGKVEGKTERKEKNEEGRDKRTKKAAQDDFSFWCRWWDLPVYLDLCQNSTSFFTLHSPLFVGKVEGKTERKGKNGERRDKRTKKPSQDDFSFWCRWWDLPVYLDLCQNSPSFFTLHSSLLVGKVEGKTERKEKNEEGRDKRTKKAAPRRLFFLVPVVGLEPTRCCHQRILSPHRLPFRHTGLFDLRAFQIHNNIIISQRK